MAEARAKRGVDTQTYRAPDEDTIKNKTKIITTLVDATRAIEELGKQMTVIQRSIVEVSNKLTKSQPTDDGQPRMSELLQALDESIGEIKNLHQTDESVLLKHLTTADTIQKAQAERTASHETVMTTKLKGVEDSMQTMIKMVPNLSQLKTTVDNIQKVMSTMQIDLGPVEQLLTEYQASVDAKINELKVTQKQSTDQIVSITKSQTPKDPTPVIKTEIAGIATELAKITKANESLTAKITTIVKEELSAVPKGEVEINIKDDLSAIIRDEVGALIRTEMQSVIRTEVQSIIRTEVQSVVRTEVQSVITKVMKDAVEKLNNKSESLAADIERLATDVQFIKNESVNRVVPSVDAGVTSAPVEPAPHAISGGIVTSAPESPPDPEPELPTAQEREPEPQVAVLDTPPTPAAEPTPTPTPTRPVTNARGVGSKRGAKR